MLQAKPEALDIVNGVVVDRDTGVERLPLSELGRIVYFRGDTLPADLPRELVATRHYTTKQYPFAFTNGVQASHLEVDAQTAEEAAALDARERELAVEQQELAAEEAHEAVLVLGIGVEVPHAVSLASGRCIR